MASSRLLGAVFIGVAVFLLTLATGGFSAATVDHSSAVSVASTEAAYLGIDGCTVQNQYHTPISLGIQQNETTETVELAVGEETTVETTGAVTLIVSGTSDQFSTEITHGFDCSTADSAGRSSVVE